MRYVIKLIIVYLVVFYIYTKIFPKKPVKPYELKSRYIFVNPNDINLGGGFIQEVEKNLYYEDTLYLDQMNYKKSPICSKIPSSYILIYNPEMNDNNNNRYYTLYVIYRN